MKVTKKPINAAIITNIKEYSSHFLKTCLNFSSKISPIFIAIVHNIIGNAHTLRSEKYISLRGSSSIIVCPKNIPQKTPKIIAAIKVKGLFKTLITFEIIVYLSPFQHHIL